MKPHLCKQCSDKNPDNFYPTQKSICKKCTILRSQQRKGGGDSQAPKQHHCVTCGETNPDQFYPKNKGRCKTCAIAYQKEWYASLSNEERLRVRKMQSAFQDNNMIHFRYMSARNRAAKKGIDFTIQEQHLWDLWDRQEGKCYYTGQPMVQARDVSKSGPSSYSISLDRLDNARGYVEGNVVLCCAAINVMKNNLPMDDFKEMIALLAARLDQF